MNIISLQTVILLLGHKGISVIQERDIQIISLKNFNKSPLFEMVAI